MLLVNEVQVFCFSTSFLTLGQLELMLYKKKQRIYGKGMFER